jgi:hypothetical protein
MPFGLTNAPTTFMRLMDDVLRPFTNSFVVVSLDHILIFNRTWEENMWHIQQVFSTLRQHKLYANLEKISFGMNRVEYLGYIVDEHGVHVDPINIQVIHDWLAPTTLIDGFCLDSPTLHGPSTKWPRAVAGKSSRGRRNNNEHLIIWSIICAQFQYSPFSICSNHSILRPMLLTMLYV